MDYFECLRSIAMTHHVYMKCYSFSIVPISLEDGFISYAFHSFSYCFANPHFNGAPPRNPKCQYGNRDISRARCHQLFARKSESVHLSIDKQTQPNK